MNIPEPVSPRDALDIIFANRNRAYGAYPLRREYPQTMRRALGWGMLLISFFIALPYFIDALSAALPTDKEELIACYFGSVPLIEVPPPSLPIIETPPPVRSTLIYKPPLVLRNEDVQEEVLPAAVEEIVASEAAVGTKTQTGDPDAPSTLEDDPTGLETCVEAPPTMEKETYELFDLQKPPTFPGGEKELLKFLAKNIQYPPLARENNIQGNVALTFVVTKDGEVSEVVLLRDIGGGCGQEALRIMNSMPCWKPGEINGHPVKVRFTLPVRFRLE